MQTLKECLAELDEARRIVRQRKQATEMINAEVLNDHLRGGGAVQVTTGARSTIYTSEHAGWFSTGTDGNLYVQWGRKKNCLTFGEGKHLLVGLRLSRTPTS